MITEDYVSFETAKLLKEKGFDCICVKCYDFDGSLVSVEPNCYADDNNVDWSRWTNAPTLAIAMKWLRDIHRLVINIEYIDFLEHGEVWSYEILNRDTFQTFTKKCESFTEHSYEQSCEAAIKYCLENLIGDEN